MATATPIFATQKRPRLGLLSVASLLPADIEWRRGIQYLPEGCSPPDTYALCGPGSGDKPLPTVPEVATFNPFIIALPDGCNDPWMSDDEWRQRAQRGMLAGQGAGIAKELLTSTVGNPSMSGDAIDVSGGVAVGWERAAATLLCAMQDAGYVGDVVFHAPTFLQPSFGASQIGDTESGTRRSWIGANPVVFDTGYGDGTTPPDALIGADPSVSCTAGWVYATGPVEYAVGEFLDDISVSEIQEQNRKYILGERPGIVRFDVCQVFASVVEVS